MALIELTWKCTKCKATGNEDTPGIDCGLCTKCQRIEHTKEREWPGKPGQKYNVTYEELRSWVDGI